MIGPAAEPVWSGEYFVGRTVINGKRIGGAVYPRNSLPRGFGEVLDGHFYGVDAEDCEVL